MEGTKPWASKTLWFALINAALAFFPPAQEFVKNNPEIYTVIVSLVFSGLRVATKDKLIIK